MKAIGYIRVSTEEQGRSGLGLQAQRSAIMRYCQGKGWELGEVFNDTASGTDRKRPGLAQLMAAVHDGGAGVAVVAKLDRLGRSLRHLLELLAQFNGCKFVSASEQIDTTTAMGTAYMHLIATFAQLERDMIAERTRAALAVKQVKGEPLGRPPFGFRARDGKWVMVPEELAAVRQAKRWRARGATFAQIAARLDAQGVKPTKGGQWDRSQVFYLLRSRRYRGLLGK